MGGPWYVPRWRDITIRSTSYCATVVRDDGERIRDHRDASQVPLAAVAASPWSFRCSAADSVRRSARTLRAMVSAVARSIEATSFPLVITISGSRRVAPVALASSVPGRAGIPAANTSAPNASAATMVAPAATGRGHRLGYPAASRARSADSRTGPTSSTSPLVAQTSASDPRIATFVANSVVCGAIRSVASRPTPMAYTRGVRTDSRGSSSGR